MAAKRLIVDSSSSVVGADQKAIEDRLAAGTFFWLDIDKPGSDDLALLRDVFKFHPLAVEDAEHFDQRAKLDEYDDFAYLVVYGATEDEDNLVEVHFFIAEKYVVTLHRDDCPAFAEVVKRHVAEPSSISDTATVLYRAVDALVDSFFPVLAGFDDRIDVLEDAVLKQPDDAQLQEIFRMKQKLVGFRKAVSPQRDLFARLVTDPDRVPGMTPDTERYYRDIYDHLIRISDLIDSYRDLMTGSMDVYLSTVSNRLNDVMKKLTIVATIFMPLSWLTGFFGMNFGLLVNHIGSTASFLVFGVATQILIAVMLWVVFKRRGWA
jgi:magnesium transporter